MLYYRHIFRVINTTYIIAIQGIWQWTTCLGGKYLNCWAFYLVSRWSYNRGPHNTGTYVYVCICSSLFTLTSFLFRKTASTEHLDQQCCVAEDIILALLPSNKICGCQVSGSLQKYTTGWKKNCEFPFADILFVQVYSRNNSPRSIILFLYWNQHITRNKLKGMQCTCYVKMCLMYQELPACVLWCKLNALKFIVGWFACLNCLDVTSLNYKPK